MQVFSGCLFLPSLSRAVYASSHAMAVGWAAGPFKYTSSKLGANGARGRMAGRRSVVEEIWLHENNIWK